MQAMSKLHILPKDLLDISRNRQHLLLLQPFTYNLQAYMRSIVYFWIIYNSISAWSLSQPHETYNRFGSVGHDH
jgi:hypothetical protein